MILPLSEPPAVRGILSHMLTRGRTLIALALFLILLTNVALFTNVNQVPSASLRYLSSISHSKLGSERTSRLHYLIPSGIVNDAVCAGVVSALNRYPTPVVIGYKGENEYDITTHFNKLHVMDRYLATVDADDDDLMILVDGFDMVAQVPVEVIIERYFNIRARADELLANQRGITVEQLHELGIRQTILYGAGKMCFTGVKDAPLCPIFPATGMAHYRSGNTTRAKDIRFLDPRYLNSGSIIAPVGDLRKLVPAVLELIEADSVNVYDDKHYRQLHNMDQWHTATLYIRQEYQRVLDMNGGVYHKDLSYVSELPAPKTGPDDNTEYHIFIDFESEFTQTHCRNQLEMHNLQYNNHDLTATVDEDHFEEKEAFEPHNIQLPSDLYQAFGRVWDRLSSMIDVSIEQSQRKWIQSLGLGTNIVSGKIYAFYHNTCNKTLFLDRYHGFWFDPFIVPLLQDAKTSREDRTPFSPKLIDGRIWVAADPYPSARSIDPTDDLDLGGVYTDYEPQRYIDLRTMCGQNLTDLLGLKRTA